MPYKMRWVPAPNNDALAVHKELPDGFAETEEPWGYRVARGPHYAPMHFCPRCGGWIDGHATDYREDTTGPLCGRRGTAYHCARCGWELAFVGMVS
jgi:hypothetical protein